MHSPAAKRAAQVQPGDLLVTSQRLDAMPAALYISIYMYHA